METTLRLLGGRAFYRRAFLGPGRFEVRRERVEVPGLGAGLRGFRIAHLSDLHAGSFLGPGDLRHVVDALHAERVDLACLTGDLVTRRWDEALSLVPDLARIRVPEGVLGVFGNHDYHGRREGSIAALFAAAGVRMLRNQCHRVETSDGALAVVGLEDLEEGKVIDVEGARRGVREGDVELVLCHNPAGAPHLARTGCAAVLSGHTHGHQIDLPLVRRAGPPHPGDRVQHGPTACITSRGLGVVGLPLRLRANPELVVVELVAAEEPR
ncbi:MAG: metallophosphoesterase [Planctomycetota bacterium]